MSRRPKCVVYTAKEAEAGFLNLVRELCTSYARVSHQLQKMGFLNKSVLELGTRWRSSQKGFFKLCAWLMLDICKTSSCTELVLSWGSHKSNIENFSCFFCNKIVDFADRTSQFFFRLSLFVLLNVIVSCGTFSFSAICVGKEFAAANRNSLSVCHRCRFFLGWFPSKCWFFMQ